MLLLESTLNQARSFYKKRLEELTKTSSNTTSLEHMIVRYIDFKYIENLCKQNINIPNVSKKGNNNLDLVYFLYYLYIEGFPNVGIINKMSLNYNSAIEYVRNKYSNKLKDDKYPLEEIFNDKDIINYLNDASRYLKKIDSNFIKDYLTLPDGMLNVENALAYLLHYNNYLNLLPLGNPASFSPKLFNRWKSQKGLGERYDVVEYFTDYVVEWLPVRIDTNKWIQNLPSDIKKDVKENIDDFHDAISDYNKLDRHEKEEIWNTYFVSSENNRGIIRRFDTGKKFIHDLRNRIKGVNDELKTFLDRIKVLGNDVKVVYSKNNVYIVYVKTYNASNLLACDNTSWCIATSEYQFSNYTSDYSKQYMLFDFNRNDTYSRIGVTVDKNGKYTTAHLKGDEYISFIYLNKYLKEELDIEFGKYFKGISKSELSEIERQKLYNEDFSKLLEDIKINLIKYGKIKGTKYERKFNKIIDSEYFSSFNHSLLGSALIIFNKLDLFKKLILSRKSIVKLGYVEEFLKRNDIEMVYFLINSYQMNNAYLANEDSSFIIGTLFKSVKYIDLDDFSKLYRALHEKVKKKFDSEQFINIRGILDGLFDDRYLDKFINFINYLEKSYKKDVFEESIINNYHSEKVSGTSIIIDQLKYSDNKTDEIFKYLIDNYEFEIISAESLYKIYILDREHLIKNKEYWERLFKFLIIYRSNELDIIKRVEKKFSKEELSEFFDVSGNDFKYTDNLYFNKDLLMHYHKYLKILNISELNNILDNLSEEELEILVEGKKLSLIRTIYNFNNKKNKFIIKLMNKLFIKNAKLFKKIYDSIDKYILTKTDYVLINYIENIVKNNKKSSDGQKEKIIKGLKSFKDEMPDIKLSPGTTRILMSKYYNDIYSKYFNTEHVVPEDYQTYIELIKSKDSDIRKTVMNNDSISKFKEEIENGSYLLSNIPLETLKYFIDNGIEINDKQISDYIKYSSPEVDILMYLDEIYNLDFEKYLTKEKDSSVYSYSGYGTLGKMIEESIDILDLKLIRFIFDKFGYDLDIEYLKTNIKYQSHHYYSSRRSSYRSRSSYSRTLDKKTLISDILSSSIEIIEFFLNEYKYFDKLDEYLGKKIEELKIEEDIVINANLDSISSQRVNISIDKLNLIEKEILNKNYKNYKIKLKEGYNSGSFIKYIIDFESIDKLEYLYDLGYTTFLEKCLTNEEGSDFFNKNFTKICNILVEKGADYETVWEDNKRAKTFTTRGRSYIKKLLGKENRVYSYGDFKKILYS
jgi:hypothetical protein